MVGRAHVTFHRTPHRSNNNLGFIIPITNFLIVFSGAGKTTFLTCIAGKCTLPGTGIVTVNGTRVQDLQGVAEMVPQFDVFMEELTVLEHLKFMV